MSETMEKILLRHKRGRSELIPILQEVQTEFGYLPEDALVKVADHCRMETSQVFGVASFYDQFRFAPLGRNRISVCRGTACHVRGAPQILEEIKRILDIDVKGTTPDLEYSLNTVACIGCCALAPCLTINEKVYGRLTPQKVRLIFDKRKEE